MFQKNKTNKKFSKDGSGVSPVIGVILMVAITVIMAAIVASWSAGVKAPTMPTTVGVDISRSSANITLVVTSIDPPSSAPIPLLNISYQNFSGTQFFGNSTNITNADVGNTITINTYSTSTNQLIIVATFKDGSKKVLYSREI